VRETGLIGSFGLMLGLAILAAPGLAAPVKHGAFDICQVEEGSQTEDLGTWERCCATVKSPSHPDGQKTCVTCEKKHADNCSTTTERPAPATRVPRKPGSKGPAVPPAETQ